MYERFVADLRPIGPSGSMLYSHPGTRYGLSWGSRPDYQLEITSISVTPSAVLAGTGIQNPQFNISFRGNPSGVSITTDGTGWVSIPSPFTSFTWSGYFSSGVYYSNRIFNIVATGIGGSVATGSVSIANLPRHYFGFASSGSTYNNTFITSLGTNILASGHYGQIYVDIDEASKTLFYAAPNSTTPGAITAYNFRFPLILATGTSINVTNEAGAIIPYRLFRMGYNFMGEIVLDLDGAF